MQEDEGNKTQREQHTSRSDLIAPGNPTLFEIKDPQVEARTPQVDGKVALEAQENIKKKINLSVRASMRMDPAQKMKGKGGGAKNMFKNSMKKMAN